MKNTFSKQERLCSKKQIDALFKTGKAAHTPLFRIIHRSTSTVSDFPIQVMVSVPKRNFKRAVDRNRIKRLVKEVYRQNKYHLYNSLGNKRIIVALLFKGKEIPTYSTIQDETILSLQRLEAIYGKNC